MAEISSLLLPWFDRHGRKDLPWQQQVSPYRVWLSEIMLQQTQVATVIPYFERFVESFPDVLSLASASQDRVLQHWAGLGYYARARNLHKAAQLIRDEYGGQFPQSLDQLIELPGVGRSTAGAIQSLAFGETASILDGNVKRVISRVFQVAGWAGHSGTLKELWRLAELHTPAIRTASYNQAMMDLGAMLCKRSRPRCDACPLKTCCLSYEQYTQALYPQSKPRKQRPQKHRWFLLHRNGNRFLLERRPARGIWGGLWSLPEIERLDALPVWQNEQLGKAVAASAVHENLVKHQFSHFDLSISLVEIRVSQAVINASPLQVREDTKLQWIAQQELHEHGLPAPVEKLLAAQK